jgi:hypothetical protein
MKRLRMFMQQKKPRECKKPTAFKARQLHSGGIVPRVRCGMITKHIWQLIPSMRKTCKYYDGWGQLMIYFKNSYTNLVVFKINQI